MNSNVNIFLAKLQQCINLFEEIDNLIDENRGNMSRIDSELSDWIHKLQCDDTLTKEQMGSIALKIKELRKVRADLCNESTLISMFRCSGRSLFFKKSRTSFVEEISDCVNNFNAPYHNRIITENDIKNVISAPVEAVICDAPKKGSPNRHIDMVAFTKCVKMGMKAPEIAKELNMGVSTVYKLKKGIA